MPATRQTQPAKTSHKLTNILLLVVVLTGLAFAVVEIHRQSAVMPVVTVATTTKTPTATKPAITPTPKAAPNACASNGLSQLALVSISQRHMWACDGTQVAYDSPVITGMEDLAADLTPTGTYHIYGKITDTTLSGHDSTGSWNDPVSYWMPFLHNQYGSYGFHDATWRDSSAFGNVSPYSSDASHGCVELPLATAQWLYSWASVGTTVTIVS